MSLHKRTKHPGPDVPGCFGCHVSGITMGGRTAATSELGQREAVLSRDLDAYKRMRRNGMQPAHVNGASYVEAEARSPIEVTHPRIIGLSDEARSHAAAAADVAATIPDSLSRFKEGT